MSFEFEGRAFEGKTHGEGAKSLSPDFVICGVEFMKWFLLILLGVGLILAVNKFLFAVLPWQVASVALITLGAACWFAGSQEW